MLRNHDVPAGFVVLLTTDRLDPIDEPDAAMTHIDHLVTRGANAINVRFVHRSLPHYLEQLGCFAKLAGLHAETEQAG